MPEPIITKKHKKRSRRSKQLRKLGLPIFTLLMMALIVFIAYTIFFPAEEEFVLDFYTYATVDKRDFLDSLTASGTIKPKTIAELKSEINADIVEVFITEGQDVTAGDPILKLYSQDVFDELEKISTELNEARLALEHTLGDQDFELALAELKVESAMDQVATKIINLELQQTLYQYGAIAKIELTKAEQELRETQQALTKVEKELENTIRTHANALATGKQSVVTLEEKLADINQKIASLTITAPIDGRVLALNIPNNNSIKVGDSVAEIADLTTQFIELEVNPSQASRFSQGTAAEVTVGQANYPAVVSYIAPQARQTQDSSVVLIRLDFLENTINIRPNSNATVSIHLGIYHDSLYLPRGAYLTSGQQLFVYVIDGNQAIQQDVQFGMLQGNNIQILGGLEIGDQVIISSYDQFRTMQEVTILPEGGRAID